MWTPRDDEEEPEEILGDLYDPEDEPEDQIDPTIEAPIKSEPLINPLLIKNEMVIEDPFQHDPEESFQPPPETQPPLPVQGPSNCQPPIQIKSEGVPPPPPKKIIIVKMNHNALVCKICKCEFKEQKYLDWHNNMAHTQPQHCPFQGCGRVYNTRIALTNHLKSHNIYPASESPVKVDQNCYPCKFPGCSKVFLLKSSLYGHMAVHSLKITGNESQIGGFLCSKCGRSYESQSILDIHVRMVCSKFRCHFEDCGQSFSKQCSLDDHLARKHEGSSNVTCTFCGSGFSKNPPYQRHLLLKHFDALPRSKMGQNLIKLRKLQISLSGINTRRKESIEAEEPKKVAFGCRFQGCDESFDEQCELQKHIKNHKFGYYKIICQFCGMGYTTKQQLERHLLLRHFDLLPPEKTSENRIKLEKLLT